MQLKSQRDFWAGLMFVVTGALFAAGALNYSFGSSARPGPGYFPFGLGVILSALGAFIIFEALTVKTEDGEPIGAWAWKPVGIITAAVVLFGVLLPHMGLVVALPVLVVVSAMASDEFNWSTSLINALVLTVFSWLVFVKGLGLTIPMLPNFLTATVGG
jgi:hypothetical protein